MLVVGSGGDVAAMARGVFPIPWKEALGGSKLAVENAKRLAEDAEVLRQNLRFESAFWVSLNAWEELGKAALLSRHWKQRRDVDENEWFRVLCNHRMKRAAYVQNVDVLYPKSTPPKPMKEMLEQLKKASTEWQKHFDLER